MKKIYLVIADSDLDYLEHLLSYIRDSEYANRFIIKSFSKQERLLEYIKSNKELDILLTTSALLPQELLLANSAIIYLQDVLQNSTNPNYNTVYKYQPLNLLFSQIIAIFLEVSGQPLNSNNQREDTKVISVYSTTGGAGKSTIAINLAREAALRDKKVFYLNLEMLSSTPSFFETSSSYNFSKVIYYIKSNKSQLNSKLATLKRYNPVIKIEYFEPTLNPNELLDLTVDDIQLLIDSLIEVEGYDLIIIDLDATINDYVIGAFSNSNYIIWSLLDNPVYINKTEQLLNQLKQLLQIQYKSYEKKLHFIINRHLGRIENDFTGLNINANLSLPYVPEWKLINNTFQLYSSEEYNKQIQQIYSTLIQENSIIGAI